MRNMQNDDDKYVLKKILPNGDRIYEQKATPEEKKRRLANIYDVINEIARAHEAKGEDWSDCFYTQEELEQLTREGKMTPI